MVTLLLPTSGTVNEQGGQMYYLAKRWSLSVQHNTYAITVKYAVIEDLYILNCLKKITRRTSPL